MTQPIEFRIERKLARIHHPHKNFDLTEIESEVRYDPLTGRSARICHFAFSTVPPADLQDMVNATVAHCPFCPEALHKVTPRFPDEMVPGGRLARGDALLFPNLFPYDDVSAVAVISRDHFHALDKIPQSVIENGVALGRDFIGRAAKASANGSDLYGLLTWNYMPPAGASQVHPHMQVVVTKNPGNGPLRELEAEKAYRERTRRNYLSDLLAAEKREGRRWIGESGGVAWYTPFTPTGILGDCCAVFPGKATLLDLSEADIADFATGLNRMFRYFAGLGLWSFNLTFFPDACGSAPERHWLNARLVPRFYLNPKLHVCDVAYLQLLLEERFAMVYPEETAERLKRAWDNG
ncbi:MAG: hypothetical protein HYU77_18085 [Betaproteobacteria bacterium]|nr:hypothetical protein [Betaproteobacteria bacterium]